MKFLVTFVLVSCIVRFSAAGLARRKLEFLRDSVVSCGHREGASRADVDEVLAHKHSTSQLAKCVLACTVEAGGIMKDKNVDPDGVEALTLKVYQDADRAKVAKEIATECVGITDPNPCDAGMKILQCMHEKAKAKGVSMSDD